MKSNKYIIKDSGKRLNFQSGMVRDVQDDKPRYDLIYLPMITDLAQHMADGAKKYGERNWEKSNSLEELNRFKASAFRHFIQFINGEEDERHDSALLFNIGAIKRLMKVLDVNINGNKRNK